MTVFQAESQFLNVAASSQERGELLVSNSVDKFGHTVVN